MIRNFPAHSENPSLPIKGTKLTRLGRRVFSDSIAKMKDPWGRPIYWIGGGSVTWSAGEGTDIDAVRGGYVSVTPLQGGDSRQIAGHAGYEQIHLQLADEL